MSCVRTEDMAKECGESALTALGRMKGKTPCGILATKWLETMLWNESTGTGQYSKELNTMKTKLSVLDKLRKEFDAWWKPQTKERGRFYGCSENWGAWQAYQQAKLGKVVED